MKRLSIWQNLGIGLLVALVSASIGASAKSSPDLKRRACLSHLEAIGHALAIYVAANDDSAPPYLTYVDETPAKAFGISGPRISGAHLWKGALTRYGAKDEDFYCPGDPYAHSLRPPPYSTLTNHLDTSYEHSIVFASKSFLKNGALRIKLSEIEHPEKLRYISDSASGEVPDADNKQTFAISPHGDYVNKLFLDGHAVTSKVPK